MFRNQYGEVRSGWAIALMLGAFIGLEFGLYALLDALLAPVIDDPAVFWVENSIISLAAIGVFVLLFRLLYRQPAAQMGLGRQAALKRSLLGMALGAGMFSIVFAALVLSGQAAVAPVTAASLAAVTADPAFWISALAFLPAALFEEVMTRGYMMSALKTTRKRPVILLVPAATFGLLHLLNDGVTALSVANVFLVGIFFALLFIRTGNLWMPFGCHFAWNLFQGNVYGMQVSGIETAGLLSTAPTGSPLLTGGGFGPEGGLVVTAVLAAFILWALLGLRQNPAPEWDFRRPLARFTISSKPSFTIMKTGGFEDACIIE
ncbi:MAG: CPBP family intramembrane metalloprotease [Clostridiales Family XIII bacterium]|jgi:membrane protease YdiL (CAAX protease family)|nr:CPBP family intramembrane metalloprotease [Clostridiales Family XIII bacterium]